MQKANFGFKQVDASEKPALVGEVFSSVAGRYDLMNDLMSFGLHRLWKDIFISQLPPCKSPDILDVAGGTGDIAFRLKKKFPEAKITVADINNEMLAEGKKRAIDKAFLDIEFKQADGENLPFSDNSFDYYTIAFGLRNFTDVSCGITEALRVLKPGGKYLCMEFSPVETPILKQIYDAYSFKVMPEIGAKITGNRSAYQYLVESIRQFPAKQKLVETIEEAGFKQVKFCSLNLGVLAIHSGYKI